MRLDELTESDFILALKSEIAPPHEEKSLAAGQSLRRAAVLAPLFRQAGAWHLLFTRRAERMENHKGQVAFPGGASETGETPEQTALREAEEEIGLRPQGVKILGRLPQIITISDFLVTPVVAIIPWPVAFRVYTPEVERVFSLPLTWLADRGNFMEMIRLETHQRVIAYQPRDGELLWGATAGMTREFLKRLGF